MLNRGNFLFIGYDRVSGKLHGCTKDTFNQVRAEAVAAQKINATTIIYCGPNFMDVNHMIALAADCSCDEESGEECEECVEPASIRRFNKACDGMIADVKGFIQNDRMGFGIGRDPVPELILKCQEMTKQLLFLSSHTCEFSENDYCIYCGLDGRA